MSSASQAAYLESQVLTAEPLELVCMLYRGALESVRRAGTHLSEGRIADRSKEISRALAAIGQLTASLDHSCGTLSRSLAELYDYMQRRLIEANFRQKAEPLAEVAGLLSTLLEGWERIRTEERHALEPRRERLPETVPSESGYGGYPAIAPFLAESSGGSSSHCWSF